MGGDPLAVESCSLCEPGYYSPGGNLTVRRANCTRCPGGWSSMHYGATSINFCTSVSCYSPACHIQCRLCGLVSYPVTCGSSQAQMMRLPRPQRSQLGTGRACCPPFMLSCALLPRVFCWYMQPPNQARKELGAMFLLHCPCLINAGCLPGFGGTGCAECEIGTWSSGGIGPDPTPSCQRCPGGKTTAAAGATSSLSCITLVP